MPSARNQAFMCTTMVKKIELITRQILACKRLPVNCKLPPKAKDHGKVTLPKDYNIFKYNSIPMNIPLRSELIWNISQTRTDNDFTRPAASTDKLYMNIGNREVIEVQHPQPSTETNDNSASLIRLHLGPIGCGKDTVRLDAARVEFARKHSLLATDVEMSSVLDSIIGNCRDSFILVKGKAGVANYSKWWRLNDFFSYRNFGLQRWNHNQEMAKLCISHGCFRNEKYHLWHGCTDQCLNLTPTVLPSNPEVSTPYLCIYHSTIIIIGFLLKS